LEAVVRRLCLLFITEQQNMALKAFRELYFCCAGKLSYCSFTVFKNCFIANVQA